jgi:hypothetical protein
MKNSSACPNVAGEFGSEQISEIALLRSSPRGAFYGDLKYRVTLSKSGFGSKISTADLGGDTPFHSRLLPDLAWVKTLERSEWAKSCDGFQ